MGGQRARRDLQEELSPVLRATSEEDGVLAYCRAQLEGPVRTTDEPPMSAASAAPGTPGCGLGPQLYGQDTEVSQFPKKLDP